MHITNVVESINESEEAEITESSVFCHIENLDAGTLWIWKVKVQTFIMYDCV